MFTMQYKSDLTHMALGHIRAGLYHAAAQKTSARLTQHKPESLGYSKVTKGKFPASY